MPFAVLRIMSQSRSELTHARDGMRRLPLVDVGVVHLIVECLVENELMFFGILGKVHLREISISDTISFGTRTQYTVHGTRYTYTHTHTHTHTRREKR